MEQKDRDQRGDPELGLVDLSVVMYGTDQIVNAVTMTIAVTHTAIRRGYVKIKAMHATSDPK